MADRKRYEHLTGWGADLLVSIDSIDLGLLGIIARTSCARRQVIFCVLAHVAETALNGIEDYSGPVLCDEVIALKPVARDLRKLPTPALLARYVPGGSDELRLALTKTASIQPPEYYRDLARRCRVDGAYQSERAAPVVCQHIAEIETKTEEARS